ncbi:MAG: hypothetical protein WCP28_17685 [Actinomycetes bacterium]
MAWVRSVAALIVVWVLSFLAVALHLTALVAAVWVVATLVLVPIGVTLVDRLVALLLLAAAPAVLIAWVTPVAAWLVGPPILTSLLGSLVAVAWAVGWTRSPVVRSTDWVSIGLGLLTAGFFWLPYAGAGLARTLGALSTGFDQSAHYFMWMRVWANHGYLLANTLSDPDYWQWRVYPQGAQAVLADLGTVLTGSGQPPAQADTSVTMFVILSCAVAGALALVTAWSVDRLSRSRRNVDHRRVIVFQILAVLLVAVGPGSVIAVQSLSFAAGLVLVIPGMALAATASRCPRREGVLLGASLIAAAAVYPICALMAAVLWPLYLWTSRRYWTASSHRRWYGAGWTALVAVLCAPMFVLLALRGVDHNWETSGYFQVITFIAFVGIAIVLAVLIAVAPGRLPKSVQYACWVAAAVSVVLAAGGILEWATAGAPSYYTVKTMYLGWMLSVIAVAAGLVSVRECRPAGSAVTGEVTGQTGKTVLRPRDAAAAVVVISALLVGLAMISVDGRDPTRGWLQATSKQAWLISNSAISDRFGTYYALAAQYATHNQGITVVVPCVASGDQTAIRWAWFLNGGMSEVQWQVFQATCSASAQAPLGTLPEYLKAHPEVTVNALAIDENVYRQAAQVKVALDLSNLTVVPRGA